MKSAAFRTAALLGTMAAFATAGCGERSAAAEEYRPTHVDSIFPIEEEVRRFKAALGTSALTLDDGAHSGPDALVQSFIIALESSDTAALRRMALTPAEFIDLYYPHTRFTAKPYEMSPQLVWFQLENYGSRGLTRALARMSGRDLGYTGYRCDGEVVEGPNRILGGCVVRLRAADGAESDVSLFGQIISRDGRYKFISFGNSL